MDDSRLVIDLLKDYIAGIDIAERLDEAQMQLACELDRRKVNNLSADETNALYEDVMWLKCEVCRVENKDYSLTTE